MLWVLEVFFLCILHSNIDRRYSVCVVDWEIPLGVTVAEFLQPTMGGGLFLNKAWPETNVFLFNCFSKNKNIVLNKWYIRMQVNQHG